MNFNPTSIVEPLYFRPHGIGDWSGHIPFAYDLVADLRPSVIVELGAHYGQSYFAFCQAVDECEFPCQTFAVDTWNGDRHTGSYGEDVFREVSAYNGAHYERFSKLLRMSFDEALPRFHDESIDILHIDGLHTYDAVLHDLETWMPKVRAGGIILMHDTQVRREDFGIWRLWQEMPGQYQTFEFLHSCGLGVLRKPGVDNSLPGSLIDLLFKGDKSSDWLRRFYTVCGDRLTYKDQVERLQRSGQWEVLAQVYWREPEREFSEERSSKTYRTITLEKERIRLELPQDMAVEKLRVDLKEGPHFFRLHAIKLLTPNESLLWSLSMPNTREEFLYSGFRLIFTEDGSSALVARTEEQCSMLLPIPSNLLEYVRTGGTLEIELSGMESSEYVTTVADKLQEATERVHSLEGSLSTAVNQGAALARAFPWERLRA